MRLQGEDARAGEVLLEPGTTINAAALALLASLGKTSISVSRQPRILHLTTGDENCPSAPDAKIRADPQQQCLADFRALPRAGVARVQHHHAADDLKTMLDLLRSAKSENTTWYFFPVAPAEARMTLLRGFSRTWRFVPLPRSKCSSRQAAHFGQAQDQVLFGLPGNALSHFVCFHLFVRRALDRLLGRPAHHPIKAVIAEPMLETSNTRETWWPARIGFKEGRTECRALAWKSSGDITRLPAANGLIKVPASTSASPCGNDGRSPPTRDILFKTCRLSKNLATSTPRELWPNGGCWSKARCFPSPPAGGNLLCARATIRLLKRAALPKGDVLGVARIAGIQAVKRTSDLIHSAIHCHCTKLRLIFASGRTPSKSSAASRPRRELGSRWKP